MPLHYLDFDFSDEDSGRGSFDAMASVAPQRLPALLDEISSVLRWARAAWGPAGALQDEGDWDFLLEASDDTGQALGTDYDPATQQVRVALPADPAPALRSVTLTFTLSGSAGFSEALKQAFPAAH